MLAIIILFTFLLTTSVVANEGENARYLKDRRHCWWATNGLLCRASGASSLWEEKSRRQSVRDPLYKPNSHIYPKQQAKYQVNAPNPPYSNLLRQVFKTQMMRRNNPAIFRILRRPAATTTRSLDDSSPFSGDLRSFPLQSASSSTTGISSGTRSPLSSSSSSLSSLIDDDNASSAEEETNQTIIKAASSRSLNELEASQSTGGDISYIPPPSSNHIKPPFKIPNDGKLVAVFDLDETLIQVISHDFWPHQLIQAPTDTVKISGKDYLVLPRPDLTELLEWCRERFHLVLWTLAEKKYAEKVLKFIDPDQRYFPTDRRLYADFHRSDMSKDLRLLGQNMQRVALFDNCWKNYEKQMIDVTVRSSKLPKIRSAVTNGMLLRDFTVSNLIAFGKHVYLKENEAIKEYLKQSAANNDVTPASIQGWLDIARALISRQPCH